MMQATQWRRMSIVVAGIALGAAGASIARSAVAPNLPPDRLQALVWIVISVPLGGGIGALLAQPSRWSRSAGWFGVVYFFSVFAAARLERLLVGREAAAADGHRLYFTLAIVLQVAGSLIVAWYLTRGRPNDTL